MKINNVMPFVSKTFAIIGYLCVISAQTFTNNNNNVTGPTTIPQFITTTTLASILSNNYSYSTPFVPGNVSPINFQHTDAVHSGGTLAHFHSLPTAPSSPITSNNNILFGNEVKSLSELPLETLLKIKKHLEEMTNGMTQAENVVYPVYESPLQTEPHGGLSPGYLNLGGGTFGEGGGRGGYEHDAPAEDVGFVTHGQFTKSGEVVNFYDHSKTDNSQGENGYGYITPQPFIHKFKKKHASEVWDEKPSKIQTIFQVSVTALSFLAFGGYLLCLILAALKAKGTAYYPAKGQLLANKPSIQNAPVIVPPNKKRRPSYGRRKRSTDAVAKRAEAIKGGIYDEIYGEENLPFNHEQMFHALISIAEGYVKFNDFYHK